MSAVHTGQRFSLPAIDTKSIFFGLFPGGFFLFLTHGWEQSDGDAIFGDLVLTVVIVLAFVGSPAEIRIPGSVVGKTALKGWVISVDQDWIGTLIVEDNRFLLVLAHGVSYGGSSFLKNGHKESDRHNVLIASGKY